MQHTISVLVENEFGVLARIAGLFSGRGFNIESLCVAPEDDARYSRMTLVTTGDDAIVEQITKQLNRLVNVIKVSDVTADDHVERELALVRMATPDRANRAELMSVVDIFRAKVVDVQPKSMMIEVTGSGNKVDAFIALVRPLGIKEISRTGRIAMTRGK